MAQSKKKKSQTEEQLSDSESLAKSASNDSGESANISEEAIKTLMKTGRERGFVTHDELNKALDILSGTYYLIKPEKLKSPKTFRAALHEAFISLNPGEHARTTLGDRLGVTGKTTRAYDKLEGIEVTPNYKRTDLTPAMIGAMPKTYHKLRLSRKTKTGKDGQKIDGAKYAQIEAIKAGGSSGIEEGKPNKTSRIYSPCLESVQRAYEFAGEGGKVQEVIRLANTYTSKDGMK